MNNEVNNITSATANKISRFEEIRGKDIGAVAFWDIVVITARDENQRRAYELQLEEKIERKQLPLGLKYHAIADPTEAKVGNGGSTMHALFQLRTMYEDTLASLKVLLIHAGGYSQRLPNASLMGKTFMPLPLGDPLYQMLEMKLITYIDFPSRMDSGVFVCSSDTIELFVLDESDQLSFKTPGITALAHQSSLLIGTTHGVFVLQETSELGSCESPLVDCLQFLHKPAIEVMKDKGAVRKHASKEFVYTDSAYYMDFFTARKLIQFYQDHIPLVCEIDAYGDFLQALGCKATPGYTMNTRNVSNETNTLVTTREKIFHLLSGTPFKVIAFKNSIFYHLGTTSEYLYHFCDDVKLWNHLGIYGNSVEEPTNKKVKMSEQGTKRICLMHCVVDERIDHTKLSVMEYCHFKNVKVGSNCIVSNCKLLSKELCEIPDNTFLSTASIKKQKKEMFVSFIFNIDDDFKQSSETVGNLTFLGRLVKDIFSNNLEELKIKLFPQNCKVYKLWEMKLFTPAETMEESVLIALRLQSDIMFGAKINASTFSNSISMTDILTKKNIEGILHYRRNLSLLLKKLNIKD